MTMLKLFLLGLVYFLVTDFIFWTTGHQTMTQCLIAKTKQDTVFGFLLFLTIIITAALLIVHFELV